MIILGPTLSSRFIQKLLGFEVHIKPLSNLSYYLHNNNTQYHDSYFNNSVITNYFSSKTSSQKSLYHYENRNTMNQYKVRSFLSICIQKDYFVNDNLFHDHKIIEDLLHNEFNNELLQKVLLLKETQEKSLNAEQKEILLLNIENQIVNLELAQYAESVTKIERVLEEENSSKKLNNKNLNKNYVRLSCDPSDNLPSLILSYDHYKRLFAFRDSSNFLFSLDRTHSQQTHIFM